MRNLPESLARAHNSVISQFDRLYAVSHGKGEYAPQRRALQSAPGKWDQTIYHHTHPHPRRQTEPPHETAASHPHPCGDRASAPAGLRPPAPAPAPEPARPAPDARPGDRRLRRARSAVGGAARRRRLGAARLRRAALGVGAARSDSVGAGRASAVSPGVGAGFTGSDGRRRGAGAPADGAHADGARRPASPPFALAPPCAFPRRFPCTRAPSPLPDATARHRRPAVRRLAAPLPRRVRRAPASRPPSSPTLMQPAAAPRRP